MDSFKFLKKPNETTTTTLIEFQLNWKTADRSWLCWEDKQQVMHTCLIYLIVISLKKKKKKRLLI